MDNDGVQVVDAKLTAGELSSFVIYALYVGSNVGSLASVISNLIQASDSTPTFRLHILNADIQIHTGRARPVGC